MPKVSVVMSVYKEPAEWMRLSIDSILNQTYKDFEFIIVNDNPERIENGQLLDMYAHQDSRIIIVTNESNIGLTKSLNKGLAVAKGEYIVRMDADDVSMPKRIEKQVRFMDKHKELAASGTFAEIIDADGVTTSKEQLSTDPVTLKNLLLFSSPMFHPSAIFRSHLDGKSVMYDETMRYAQDYALWIELFRDHPIANIPEYLIKYRCSNEQISSKHVEEQQACAKRNRDRTMDLFDIELSEKDGEIISSLVNNKSTFGDAEITNCISHLNKAALHSRAMRRDIITDFMILMYCNYLAGHYTYRQAMGRFLRVGFDMHSLSLYNFLYLNKKYLCK